MKLYSLHRCGSDKFTVAEIIGDAPHIPGALKMIEGMFQGVVDISEMSGPHTKTCQAIAQLVNASTGWWLQANPYKIGVCTAHYRDGLPAFFLAKEERQ